jgi:predicted transcriptional regulator
MKIITLRIDEEEKARLEQLAEAGDITLSRAFREGAALYLKDFQSRLDRARGADTTWWGLRRDKRGRPRSKATDPTPLAVRRVAAMRSSLYVRGLGAIREAWESGGKPAIVLSALGHWLDLVGQVYVGNAGEVGWDWFLRDYCEGYAAREAREALRKEIRSAPLGGTAMNLTVVLDVVEAGFLRLLDDATTQEVVRRAVLPAWDVLARRIAE